MVSQGRRIQIVAAAAQVARVGVLQKIEGQALKIALGQTGSLAALQGDVLQTLVVMSVERFVLLQFEADVVLFVVAGTSASVDGLGVRPDHTRIRLVAVLAQVADVGPRDVVEREAREGGLAGARQRAGFHPADIPDGAVVVSVKSSVFQEIEAFTVVC